MATELQCIVTGITKRFTKGLIQKKIDKFGTIDLVKKYYVCKEAIKLLKKGNTIEQVRQLLNVSSFNNSVDYEILYKLKLLKTGKRRKPQKTADELRQEQLQSEENERKYYELKEKMNTCLKTWVEWATGGPNKVQVPYGGTCIRPDIYYDNEGNRQGRCTPCPYNEHCLCENKEVV